MLEARQWEYIGLDGPGPGFFPLWYGGVMVALSLLLIATSIRERASQPGGAFNWGETGRVLSSWLAFAASVGLLKVLGFLLAFGLFTFFLVAVMYRRPPGVALAVSLGMAAGFYLLFPLALSVELPVGRFGF